MNFNKISLGAESSHQHFYVLYPGWYLSMKAFSEYIIFITPLLFSSLSIFSAVKERNGKPFAWIYKIDGKSI